MRQRRRCKNKTKTKRERKRKREALLMIRRGVVRRIQYSNPFAGEWVWPGLKKEKEKVDWKKEGF